MTPGRTVRDLVKAVNGSKVVEIDGSGHAMMAEKPDEVLDALRGFLESAAGPA
jgi:pimeloyl-ACP methyl ester carboxylesterase